MAKENETIADIIAEKRQQADEIERDCAEKMKRGEMTSDQYARELVADIRREADRLEAAHRRECISPDGEAGAAKRSLEGCDCAKLREAVGYILKYADSVACRDYDEHTRHYIDQIRKWAQSALAAPPRNCDIAQDWLHDLYVNFKPPASVKREMPPEWVDAVMAFCRWLVAPATEQEGGTDGNE